MKQNLRYAGQVAVVALMLVGTVSMLACTVDQILSSIDAALQVAQGLSAAVGAVDPAIGAAVNVIASIGIAGMNEIQKVYDQYEANKSASNKQNVIVAAQAIQSNLAGELAVMHISDPATVQKVTAWVNLLSDCASGIITELGGTPVAAVSTRARAVAPYQLTPEYIQSRWQSQVCLGDTSCGSKVVAHHKHAKVRL
jgi:hypothetical protein